MKTSFKNFFVSAIFSLFLGFSFFSFAQSGFAVEAPKQNSKIPGWLAFTVATEEHSRYPFLPSHPMTDKGVRAVIFCDEATDCKEWDKITSSFPITGVSSVGEKTEIQKAGISKEMYGCEGNKVEMVYFVGPKKFTEGVVWIAPTELAKGLNAIKIETVDKKTVSEAQKQIAAIYSSNPKSVKDSRLLAAYQYGDEKTVLVYWVPGLEGNSFPVFFGKKDKVTNIGKKYLYQCAY